jgi:hypothetical protein
MSGAPRRSPSCRVGAARHAHWKVLRCSSRLTLYVHLPQPVGHYVVVVLGAVQLTAASGGQDLLYSLACIHVPHLGVFGPTAGWCVLIRLIRHRRMRSL